MGLSDVCIINYHKAKLLCLQCHTTQKGIYYLPMYINDIATKYKVVKNSKDIIIERLKVGKPIILKGNTHLLSADTGQQQHMILEATLQFICGWYLHKQHAINLQKVILNEVKRC